MPCYVCEMHVMLLSCFVFALLTPSPCFMAPTLIPEAARSPSTDPLAEVKLATVSASVQELHSAVHLGLCRISPKHSILEMFLPEVTSVTSVCTPVCGMDCVFCFCE